MKWHHQCNVLLQLLRNVVISKLRKQFLLHRSSYAAITSSTLTPFIAVQSISTLCIRQHYTSCRLFFLYYGNWLTVASLQGVKWFRTHKKSSFQNKIHFTLKNRVPAIRPASIIDLVLWFEESIKYKHLLVLGINISFPYVLINLYCESFRRLPLSQPLDLQTCLNWLVSCQRVCFITASTKNRFYDHPWLILYYSNIE